MNYAFYLGCTIPTEQYHYELSVREVFPHFGIDLKDIEGYSCCGVSIKGYSVTEWLYLAARNLALVEDMGMDMLPICNGCYNSFVEAKHFLDTRPEVKDKVNEHLKIEGLEYKGTSEVRHILEVLKNDVDIEELKSKLTTSLEGLKIATHYGCHALRPNELNESIDSEDPQIMEDFLRALGATSEYYPEKLDCCGSSLIVHDHEASFKLTGAKVQAVQKRGYDALTTVCPFCQKMCDNKQEAIKRILGDEAPQLPTFYLTQLIGIALGLDHEALGLNLNMTPVDEIIERLE
jgi:heterodisulfide reductase subunit B